MTWRATNWCWQQLRQNLISRWASYRRWFRPRPELRFPHTQFPDRSRSSIENFKSRYELFSTRRTQERHAASGEKNPILASQRACPIASRSCKPRRMKWKPRVQRPELEISGRKFSFFCSNSASSKSFRDSNAAPTIVRGGWATKSNRRGLDRRGCRWHGKTEVDSRRSSIVMNAEPSDVTSVNVCEFKRVRTGRTHACECSAKSKMPKRCSSKKIWLRKNCSEQWRLSSLLVRLRTSAEVLAQKELSHCGNFWARRQRVELYTSRFAVCVCREAASGLQTCFQFPEDEV